MGGEARVSLSEIFEVRLDGLGADEVVSLLWASSEALKKQQNVANVFDGVFSPDTIFLTREGTIFIELIPLADADEEFIPPELHGVTNPQVGEKQLVWCLGEAGARASRADLTDAALLSLLNLMTLGAAVAASRPTLTKLAQMLRNRLPDHGEGSTASFTISALFEEVMGDLEELLNDPFCDDVRLSSARSSLSIISGALRRRGSNSSSVCSSATNVSVRRRRDELARRMDRVFSLNDSVMREKHEDDEDDRSTIVDAAEADDETRSTTPRVSPTAQIGKLTNTTDLFSNSVHGNNNISFGERENYAYNNSDNDASDHSEKLAAFHETKVEVHASNTNDAHDECTPLTSAQNANTNNNNIVSARKRSTTQEKARQRSNLEDFLYGVDKIEPYESARKVLQVAPPVDENDASAPTYSKNSGAVDNPAFEASPQIASRKQFSPSRIAKENSSTTTTTTHSPASPALKTKTTSTTTADRFSRRNSLQRGPAARISSRRSGMCAANSPKSAHSTGPLRRTLSQNFAVPEFLEKSASPLIRLRAQSMKRKKIALNRSDEALVLVKLLTGQCVEVNCKTDALVSNIFDTVAAHLNITEHLFFGLALLKNSEYYFLDVERRLEKWAPAGWKSSAAHQRRTHANAAASISTLSSSNNTASENSSRLQRAASSLATSDFYLHLRFRYYPRKLEFIKTKATTHNLYLQLRQDILDGVLRFNDIVAFDTICELAAFALQAEFGAAPSSTSTADAPIYFKIDNYMPTNFYATNDATTNVSVEELEARICVCHSALGELTREDAERAFIGRCQAALGYGAHYYRVSKIKPSSSRHVAYFNRLADIHRLAIMPVGIAICREQTTTGARHVQAAYEWHAIRTLQFDRKRVLISTIENAGAPGQKENSNEDNMHVVDHVFYADHHSKSSYLVRFAASQHRFMIKMRHWQSTLVQVVKGGADAYIVGEGSKEVVVDGGNSEKENFQFPPKKSMANVVSEPKMSVSSSERHKLIVDAHLDRYLPNAKPNGLDSAESHTVHVVLTKHPQSGLGLTLVDGSVNGVHGVYVKSVADNGDAKRKDVRIGDCLLSINGTMLIDASRHDAVELVRQGGERIELDILRFSSLIEALGADPPAGSRKSTTANDAALEKNDKSKLQRRFSLDREKLMGNEIKTSSPTRKAQQRQRNNNNDDNDNVSTTPRKYTAQRAVSDFGTISDNLPVLNTDALIIETLQRRPNNQYRKRRSSSEISSSTLSPSQSKESDSDDDDYSGKLFENNSPRSLRRGKYDLINGVVTSMYQNAFHDDENDNENGYTKSGREQDSNKKPNGQRQVNFTAASKSDFEETISWATTSFDVTTLRSYTSAAKTSSRKPQRSISNGRRNTLDWTNNLSDIDDGENSSSSSSSIHHHHRRNPSVEVMQVELHRAFVGQPLGFQIGSMMVKQYDSANDSIQTRSVLLKTSGDDDTIFVVKQINSMPAAGANLKVNDIILAINGTRLRGCTHERVVELLRSADLRVKLEIERHFISTTNDNNSLEEKRRGMREKSHTTEETLCVTLDKSKNTSIGLALAKRMGHEGIFIRSIASGSLADSLSLANSEQNEANSNRLRVGDRIWAINGVCVANESSSEIARRLTRVDGMFEICVKRFISL